MKGALRGALSLSALTFRGRRTGTPEWSRQTAQEAINEVHSREDPHHRGHARAWSFRRRRHGVICTRPWEQSRGRRERPKHEHSNNSAAHSDYLSAAATYIGITVDQLRTELGTDKSLADVAIAHGKTRDGLIQALVTASQASITTLVDQKGIGAQRGPGDRGVIGDQFSVAATYLGTTTTDLRTKMQAGQTLAQIAAATSGKSRDGLVAALTADAKAKIAAAQTAGTITAAQATELTNDLTTRIANFVDTNRPQGPGRH